MSFGFWQIVIILLIGLLLFGRGRVSDLMGDVAKGIKSFKKGLSDDEGADKADPVETKRLTDDSKNRPLNENERHPSDTSNQP